MCGAAGIWKRKIKLKEVCKEIKQCIAESRREERCVRLKGICEYVENEGHWCMGGKWGQENRGSGRG